MKDTWLQLDYIYNKLQQIRLVSIVPPRLAGLLAAARRAARSFYIYFSTMRTKKEPRTLALRYTCL